MARSPATTALRAPRGISRLAGTEFDEAVATLPAEVGVGVKPIGPDSVVDEVAAALAELTALLAALSSDSPSSRTLSMMCMTPFHKRRSGVEIPAVEFPTVTNPPVELKVALSPSPAAVVTFDPPRPMRSPEYTLVPFMMWFRSTLRRTVSFAPTDERFCWAAAKASSVGAKSVTPCWRFSESSREAFCSAAVKAVRLFAKSAASRSPG